MEEREQYWNQFLVDYTRSALGTMNFWETASEAPLEPCDERVGSRCPGSGSDTHEPSLHRLI